MWNFNVRLWIALKCVYIVITQIRSGLKILKKWFGSMVSDSGISLGVYHLVANGMLDKN